MKHMRDPDRLTEPGSDSIPELAAAIRGLRAQQCAPDQVAALASALAQNAGPGAAGSSPSLAPSTKWLLGGLLVLLGSGLIWHAHGHGSRISGSESERVASAPPSPLLHPHAAAAAPPVVVSTPSVVPVAPAPVQRTSPAPASARQARRAMPASKAVAPEQELSLLRRSHAALADNAGLALAFAQEHERQYSRGIFAQERELLAIEALVRLGYTALAIERAKRFLDRYPESPHAVRVRAVLPRIRPASPPADDAAGFGAMTSR